MTATPTRDDAPSADRPGKAWRTDPTGFVWRDLNGNGRLDPYEDPRLPVTERVRDLVTRMTLPEKAGLMFQNIIEVSADGSVSTERTAMSRESNVEFVTGKMMSHFNVLEVSDVSVGVRWHNAIQQLAEETRLGIPITLSSDPRHAFTKNVGAAIDSGVYSKWPESLGLAAIGDLDLIAQFADIARQEYTALGIRAALHPTIDLATEPRWARQFNTFGQNVDFTEAAISPYLSGFRSDRLRDGGVACMAKHFPGGGPQKDGEDPHFPYGREQVYPGGRFEEHLRPFREAVRLGVQGVMPYYGMPSGLVRNGEAIEEVGFAFNKQILTGILREELGFDGVICTDWSVLNSYRLHGFDSPARAWGAEELTPLERLVKALDAGVDQFGGESSPELVIEAVSTGLVSEARVDESVSRLLRVKFELGLFDDPYVDEGAALAVVGKQEFVAAGRAAQRSAYTVLTNGEAHAPTLPLPRGSRIYAPGMTDEAIAPFGTRVSTATEADYALVRTAAPWEPRNAHFLEDKYHAGRLTFSEEQLDELLALADAVPTIIDIYLDRPAIIPELAEHAAAVVANYGASDDAFLDVVFGVAEPKGRLPFEMPSSMTAVAASRPDVASDTDQPLFPYGHGLRLVQR